MQNKLAWRKNAASAGAARGKDGVRASTGREANMGNDGNKPRRPFHEKWFAWLAQVHSRTFAFAAVVISFISLLIIVARLLSQQ